MRGKQVGDARPAKQRDQRVGRRQTRSGESSRQGARRASERTGHVVDVRRDGRVGEYVFRDLSGQRVQRMSRDLAPPCGPAREQEFITRRGAERAIADHAGSRPSLLCQAHKGRITIIRAPYHAHGAAVAGNHKNRLRRAHSGGSRLVRSIPRRCHASSRWRRTKPASVRLRLKNIQIYWLNQYSLEFVILSLQSS